MTKDEILQMPAGRELDRAVAELVMGWKLANHIWATPEGRIEYSDTFFNPSSDLGMAWEVVTKMEDKGWYWDGNSRKRSPRCVWIFHFGDKIIRGASDFLPVSICRAALLAVAEVAA
jgi:hypothetical protein